MSRRTMRLTNEADALLEKYIVGLQKSKTQPVTIGDLVSRFIIEGIQRDLSKAARVDEPISNKEVMDLVKKESNRLSAILSSQGIDLAMMLLYLLNEQYQDARATNPKITPGDIYETSRAEAVRYVQRVKAYGAKASGPT